MAYVTKFADDAAKAAWIVGQARTNGGLAPVDIERYWADNEAACRDPFGADIPQTAVGIHMSGECVYDELGVLADFWRYDHDEAWRLELNKAYNDRAEKIVGRRLLGEQPGDPARVWPERKQLSDVFEAQNVWDPISQAWWLHESARTEDELSALLDRVDARLAGDLRSFLLPPEWDREKARLQVLGAPGPLYRNQRGPVTFATSIYGVERLVFLIMDNPALAGRLRDTILRAMLAVAELLDREAGYTPQTAPRGFGFADDNCYLLTPDMYEFFGYPILKGVFDRYAPDPGDRRGQHSDSPMGHLLPVLGPLGFKDVNFGPTLTVSEIRQHCPRAVIIGQLAPFTFMRDEAEKIVLEFLRDHDQAKAKRGLLFFTAGSIDNGSRLTGLRLIMSAAQHFGRLDE